MFTTITTLLVRRPNLNLITYWSPWQWQAHFNCIDGSLYRLTITMFTCWSVLIFCTNHGTIIFKVLLYNITYKRVTVKICKNMHDVLLNYRIIIQVSQCLCITKKWAMLAITHRKRWCISKTIQVPGVNFSSTLYFTLQIYINCAWLNLVWN